MTDEAKQIVESITQACDVFAAMELPMGERECTLSYDAAMTLVKELERVKRERDAAVEELKEYLTCHGCVNDDFCKKDYPMCDGCALKKCPCYSCTGLSNWQWRGPQEDPDD